MAYGSIKVDNIIYDDSGDVTLPVSSIHSSISGILTVTGDIKTTGGDVVAEAGVFVGTLGAAATPTYTFSGDNNTGLYASAANQLSITTDGTERLQITTDKVMFKVDAKVDSDNARDLGTSGARWKDLYLGGDAVIDGDVSIADKIIHTGDINTAIRFPSADTITAETAGSERLRITSSGRVGIGTTSPDSPLQVGVLDSPGTLRAGLTVKTVSNGLGNSESAIYLEESSGGEGYYLRVDSDGGLAFDNSAATTPTLYLSDSDNVGIGTTSPTAQYGTNLNIEHATSSALHLTTVNSGTSITDGFHIINSSGIAYLWNREDTDMAFATDNTEAMRIDSSGNVGIGTTSPSSLLDVNGGATFAGLMKSSQAQVEVASTATNNLYGGNSYFGGTGDSSGNANASILNTGAATFAGRISQGDGTASGNGIQSLNSDTNTANATFYANNYGSGGNVWLGFGGGSATSTITGAGAATFAGDLTVNTDALFVDASAKKVGIGLTNPGDYHANANALVIDGGITLANTAGGYIYFADSATGTGEYIGQINYDHTNNYLQFIVNDSEALRIDSSGNVGIGTDSPEYIFDARGSINISGSIFRRGADNATFSITNRAAQPLTFGTDDTERMRIDSSGRLLVGTTTEGNSEADNLTIADSGDCGITLRAGTSSSSRLYFSDGTSGADEYRGIITYAHDSDSMRFWTNATEKLRIDSSGNVGIGISPNDIDSVGRALNVGSSSGGAIYLQDTDSPTTKFAAISYVGATAALQIHAHHSASYIDFGTAGTEWMRIDSDGDIIYNGLNHDYNNASGAVIASINPGVAYTDYTHRSANFIIQTGTGSASEAMRIDSSGRLLVGTTTPGYSTVDNFTIADSSDCGITIRSGSSSASSLYFADGTTGSAEYEGWVDYLHSVNALRFGSGGGVERMRIDSTGRLLLGTTAEGYNNGADNLTIADSGHCGMTIRSGTSSYGSIYFSDGTSGAAEYRGYIDYYHLTDTLRINSSGPTVMTIAGTAAMTIDSGGDVGIGKTAYTSVSTVGHWFGDTGWAHHCTSSGDAPLYLNRNTSDGNLVTCYRSGVNVGSISVTTTATAYNESSDYRLKENVVDIVDGITRVKQLQPRKFNFIIDPDTTIDGFIAHEVSSIVPQAITGEKDAMKDEEYEVTPAVEASEGVDAVPAVMGTRSVPDYQGIDKSKLVPLLTAALQEAITKIETLETKVAALEAA